MEGNDGMSKIEGNFLAIGGLVVIALEKFTQMRAVEHPAKEELTNDWLFYRESIPCSEQT